MIRKTLRTTPWLLALVAALLLGACEQAHEDAMEDVSLPEAGDPDVVAEPGPADDPGETTVAVARLTPRDGLGISGMVTFSPEGDGVKVLATVSGVEGEGEHGFHVHETGDCSAADFTSAGGHFAPEGHPHAGPDDDPRHAGDLGNIEIDGDGEGRLELETDRLSLDPQSPGYVVGKGVILHEGRDDLTSQPTGDAGGRLACGVVELADLAAGFSEEEVEEFSEAATEQMEEATADGDVVDN